MNRSLRMIMMIISLQLAACAGPEVGGLSKCPEESHVIDLLGRTATTDDSRERIGSTNVQLLSEARIHRRFRCYYLARREYGGSGSAQHVATRLVIWDATRGFLGMYAIEDINLYPDAVGGFAYVDSEGEEKVLQLGAENLPGSIWFDGEIRALQSVPK